MRSCLEKYISLCIYALKKFCCCASKPQVRRASKPEGINFETKIIMVFLLAPLTKTSFTTTHYLTKYENPRIKRSTWKREGSQPKQIIPNGGTSRKTGGNILLLPLLPLRPCVSIRYHKFQLTKMLLRSLCACVKL